jgi:hypothetical protein
MNSSILGSNDHRGSSCFHHRIEELFCFVQFYWIHCDRFSISIYFLIKKSHFLGTVTGLNSSEEETESGTKYMILKILILSKIFQKLAWKLIHLSVIRVKFIYMRKKTVQLLILWVFGVFETFQLLLAICMGKTGRSLLYTGCKGESRRNKKWKEEIKCGQKIKEVQN